MLRSEYDDEQSQVRLADNFGQVISLSSEQSLMFFRWLFQLFSRCQGCGQLVSHVTNHERDAMEGLNDFFER